MVWCGVLCILYYIFPRNGGNGDVGMCCSAVKVYIVLIVVILSQVCHIARTKWSNGFA